MVQRLGRAGFDPQISSLVPGCVGRPARFWTERIPCLVVTAQVQAGFSETSPHHRMIYSVLQEFLSQEDRLRPGSFRDQRFKVEQAVVRVVWVELLHAFVGGLGCATQPELEESRTGMVVPGPVRGIVFDRPS